VLGERARVNEDASVRRCSGIRSRRAPRSERCGLCALRPRRLPPSHAPSTVRRHRSAASRDFRVRQGSLAVRQRYGECAVAHWRDANTARRRSPPSDAMSDLGNDGLEPSEVACAQRSPKGGRETSGKPSPRVQAGGSTQCGIRLLSADSGCANDSKSRLAEAGEFWHVRN
jgi:hypothetical protein